MKNINITNIVDPTSLQPFTGNSLKFLQDASSEARAGMIKAFITQNLGSYSLTVPYVISGCVVSDSGKDVTDGEIFYGGEYYELTGVNGTTNIAQFSTVKTQDATADPLDFSDGQTHNVHDIFKFVGTDTATTGTFDSSELVSAYGAGKISVDVASVSQATTSTSYADLALSTYTTPNDGITRTWLINFTSSVAFAPSGSTTIGGKAGINTSAGGGSMLRECEVKLEENAGVDILATTIGCAITLVASVPPNTTIKVQILCFSGGSGNINFTNNGFTMVEL
jgi:hypothetical protein